MERDDGTTPAHNQATSITRRIVALWVGLLGVFLYRNWQFLSSDYVENGDAALEALRVEAVLERHFAFFEGHYGPVMVAHPGALHLWLQAAGEALLHRTGLVANIQVSHALTSATVYLLLLAASIVLALTSDSRRVAGAYLSIVAVWTVAGTHHGEGVYWPVRLAGIETDMAATTVALTGVCAALAFSRKRPATWVVTAGAGAFLANMHWLTFLPGLAMIAVSGTAAWQERKRSGLHASLVAVASALGLAPLVGRLVTQRDLIPEVLRSAQAKIGHAVQPFDAFTAQTLPWPSPMSAWIAGVVLLGAAAHVISHAVQRRNNRASQGGNTGYESNDGMNRGFAVAFALGGVLYPLARFPEGSMVYLGAFYRIPVELLFAAILVAAFRSTSNRRSSLRARATRGSSAEAVARWSTAGRRAILAGFAGWLILTAQGLAVTDAVFRPWPLREPGQVSATSSALSRLVKDGGTVAVATSWEREEIFDERSYRDFTAAVTVMLLLREAGHRSCYLDQSGGDGQIRTIVPVERRCPADAVPDIVVNAGERKDTEPVAVFEWREAQLDGPSGRINLFTRN